MRIGIVGNLQFAKQMLEAKEKLLSLGHEPFISSTATNFVGKTPKEIEVLKQNGDATLKFWEMMQEADALLVVNLERNGKQNYIGGNTFLEMGFAFVLRQKIFLWNPLPEIPYYYDEMIAMKPIVINGDLTLIK